MIANTPSHSAYQTRRPASAEHVVVYRDPARFCAWPFNGGLWQFADGELALGFFRGPCDYKTPESVNHGNVDREHVIIRSRDGGKTWPADSLTVTFQQDDLAAALRGSTPAFTSDLSFDPRADGFCLLGGFGLPPKDATHLAYVMISTDHAKTWTKPLRLPAGIIRTTGFKFLASRPSYIVRNDGMLLCFGHGTNTYAASSDFQAETALSWGVVHGSWNGGASWGIVGQIQPQPAQPGLIMPCPLLLNDGTILVAARRQYDAYNAHTTIHQSDDGGRTWNFLSRANDWGAPAHLLQLPDQRILCTYGYRQQPWGVRARLSENLGKSWGPEIILRDDGGSWDVGYPRSVLKPDGSILTAYYINLKSDTTQLDGGTRHIAATLWRP